MKLATAICAVFLLSVAPTAAQDGMLPPSVEVVAEEAHEQFAAALTSDLVIRMSFEQTMGSSFAEILRSDPELAEMDVECPGAIDAMITASRPIMWSSHQRDYLVHRDELTALFARKLTVEEAQHGVDLYTSELGRRVMVATLQNTDISQSLAATIENDDALVDEETFAIDKRETVKAATEVLSESDKQEMARILSTTSLGPALVRVHGDIEQLQLKLLNADFLPEEYAALAVAMDEALEKKLAVCDAEQ